MVALLSIPALVVAGFIVLGIVFAARRLRALAAVRREEAQH